MKNKKIGVVIARYNENIDWVKNINHNIYLYNKGEDHILDSINLPNVGREAQTYLYHIVKNYEKLDDYTVFLQGNPYDHAFQDHYPSIEMFNNVTYKKDFYPFNLKDCGSGFDYYTCDLLGKPNLNPNVDLAKFCHDHNFTLDIKNNLVEFVQGAQFAVSKQSIHKKNKSIYEKLLYSLSNNNPDPSRANFLAHVMERLWKYILT